MAIVVRRACLRERQLRPHPARGAGGDRRRQPRPRRLLRRRRVDRAAADGASSAHFGARRRRCSRSSTARARTSSACARCCGRGRASICAESAHLNVDEGGAPEAMGGIKLLTVPTPDGKLTPELVDAADRADRRRARRPARRRVGHAVDRARHALLASRSCAALAESRARARDAVPHRRLAAGQRGRVAGRAAARRSRPTSAPTSSRFGGTKIGLLAGEAVVVLQPGARAVAAVPAQAVDAAGVEDALRLARSCWRCSRATCGAARPGHANAMARAAGRRRAATRSTITQAVQANAVFAILPPGAAERAPARLQVLRLERAHRRGALDVLLGHDRGGRRRVRRGDPRRRRARGCRPRTPRAMTRRSA